MPSGMVGHNPPGGVPHGGGPSGLMPHGAAGGMGHQMSGADVGVPSNEDCGIRDVWKYNLEKEFQTIRRIVQKYHYVAMDTEFPGVVARPVGEFRSTADYHYQLLRCNVDLLRIIQLGLTFMDDEGKTPPGYSTWQFNFKFNLSEDMYAQDSIELLQNSGIQFQEHEKNGIEPLEFAELLMCSGIVLDDDIKWLCFHSGYDFGYLLKLLTDQNLPAEEAEFFELLRLYFPNVYDIKYLMKSCKNLKGGLQEVADQLELRRVGPQHQAGSDALLTGMAFFKMREVYTSAVIHTTAIYLVDTGPFSHYEPPGLANNPNRFEADRREAESALNTSNITNTLTPRVKKILKITKPPPNYDEQKAMAAAAAAAAAAANAVMDGAADAAAEAAQSAEDENQSQ